MSVKGVRRTFILPFTDKKKIHNSDRGYETVFVHILLFNFFFTFVSNGDPKDWCTNNTDCIVKRVVKNVKDGDIILLHDASSSSVEAALQIIDCLQAEGYQFVTVEEFVLN